MTKYRIVLALLCGAGFTSIVLLLTKLLMPTDISLLLSVLLIPGSLVAVAIVKSQALGLGPPLLVLAADAVIYAAASFVGFSTYGRRRIAPEKMRLVSTRLVFPVAILVGLGCVPSLNPLWPHRMTELTKEERALQDALPLGIGLNGARAVLRSKGVQFQEWTAASTTVVLDRPYGTVSASAGDQVIAARLETDAFQFPCGYDIDIALVFGPDKKMEDQYVRRFPMCP